MNKKQYLSLLFATIISSLVGGAGFSWLFSGQQASAQNNSKIISAQEFRLVDASGNVRALFTDDPKFARGTPSLMFYDRKNKIRLAVGQYELPAPNIQLSDENGSEVFSLTHFQGTTSMQFNRVFSDGKGMSGGDPALVLSNNAEDGANVKIFGKGDKMLWSARK